MNDILLTQQPQTASNPAAPLSEGPVDRFTGSPRSAVGFHTACDQLAKRLIALDRVAVAIGWGLPVISLFAAARLLLQSINPGGAVPGGWLAGTCEAICVL